MTVNRVRRGEEGPGHKTGLAETYKESVLGRGTSRYKGPGV